MKDLHIIDLEASFEEFNKYFAYSFNTACTIVRPSSAASCNTVVKIISNFEKTTFVNIYITLSENFLYDIK